MSKLLADTTVLVEVLRSNLDAKQFLEDTLPEISKVTVVELIQGCRNKEDLKVVVKACDLLPQVKIDLNISEMAIELLKDYNLSHGLLFLDSIIAATCIIRKKILVTENVKDFRFISGLEVISQKKAFQKQ
jgi:hypothetical protein